MASGVRSKRAWAVLTALLVVEAIGAAAIVFMTATTFPGFGDPFIALWVSVFVSVILSWVWIGATLIGAFRGRASWVRGSAVTIHVLMLAAAVGVMQGIIGTVPTGVGLAVVAAIGIIAALGAKPDDSDAAVAPEA